MNCIDNEIGSEAPADARQLSYAGTGVAGGLGENSQFWEHILPKFALVLPPLGVQSYGSSMHPPATGNSSWVPRLATDKHAGGHMDGVPVSI